MSKDPKSTVRSVLENYFSNRCVSQGSDTPITDEKRDTDQAEKEINKHYISREEHERLVLEAKLNGELKGITRYAQWDMTSFRDETSIMEVDARKVTTHIAEIYKKAAALNKQQQELNENI